MTSDDMNEQQAIDAAFAVMAAHIEALNHRDQIAIAATLHFPHLRLSGTKLTIWNSEDSYFSDFLVRAGNRWHSSSFADIQLVSASATKVHLDADGSMIASFRSLWVITFEDGCWAAKMRSSFAKA